ncbi:hypothetical protein LXA43DRAFT_1066776 [Ganoderma leucocontextum]|nr:hypothetical protein LXA43DRAFT_1066776 [Ganoderma leucocontextum]
MDLDSHILPPPTTPPPRPSKRSHQLVGMHFESPKRRRPWLKDSELVLRPGLAHQEQELTAKLNSMLRKVTWNGLKVVGVDRVVTSSTYLETIKFQMCECVTLPQALVHNGLFPTSPLQPRIAVSIDLLDFYSALFERSADAVTALAGALKTMYRRRGFSILNTKNEPIHDPFRRGLGQAIQWYDILRRRSETKVELAIEECIPIVTVEAPYPKDEDAPRISSICPVGDSGERPVQPSTECSTGERKCNQSIADDLDALRPINHNEGSAKEGPRLSKMLGPLLSRLHLAVVSFNSDVQDVSAAYDMDGVSSGKDGVQRHNLAAGDSPWFYEPKYFLSKEQVDRMGDRITAARSKGPRAYKNHVPESALDECEKSYEAANEKKDKTSSTKFDDTGLMALVCRHDIVIFLANVDTPGEQQKFGVALIEHLFSHVPKRATVVVYYDIGCVLDRSLHRFHILPDTIVERLLFATSVMHAYGHQWACQLVYNPRLREGLGLTEGEGTERLWSKFRKLIGVTRSSGRMRRIWMLDRHADVVNTSTRENLGVWIRGRLKHSVEVRERTAAEELSKIDISIDAPAKIKRELDAVLNLQTELDGLDQYFTQVRKAIAEDASNSEAYHFLESLRRTHSHTMEKVDELYASLNVTDAFPEIKGLPLEFVKTLLMARDLKINIRKRAIGTFFEWDKLDRASGTKLHQQTRKAISKRTPALVTAIRKFNNYCSELEEQYQPERSFPLPTPLPTELGPLREDASLLADVWVTRISTTVPKWLEDPKVRSGIRAVLDKDRCLEERRRLGFEADNLCRSYGRDLAAIELAMRYPKNAPILFLLRQRRDEHLLLQHRWRTPLVSDLRFKSQTSEATRLANQHSGVSDVAPIHWVHVNIQQATEEDGSDAYSSGEEADDDACIIEDTYEAMFGEDVEHCPNAYSPIPATVPVPDPGQMIERELWLSDVNPAPVTPPDSCIIPAEAAQQRGLTFPSAALGRLHEANAWLDDDCINIGTQVIMRHLGSAAARGDPVIFSSFVLPKHHKGGDEGLWRLCKSSLEFWKKDIWIFPIHSNGNHWALAIVYWRKRRIAYFDSLHSKVAFETHVKDVFTLIHRLQRLVADHGGETCSMDGDWKAYPLVYRWYCMISTEIIVILSETEAQPICHQLGGDGVRASVTSGTTGNLNNWTVRRIDSSHPTSTLFSDAGAQNLTEVRISDPDAMTERGTSEEVRLQVRSLQDVQGR